MVVIPNSFYEQLLYNTVKIETEGGSGTGFFYSIRIDKDRQINLLVTNKHVIDGAKEMSLTLHLSKIDKDNFIPSGLLRTIKIEFKKEDWLYHAEADLCCFNFSIILNQIENNLKEKVFFVSIDSSIIPKTLKEWNFISVAEQVYMVGYPRGISDEKNNYPLVRTGIFSSPPSIDFNGKREFLVDMACFNGSSGSPIFYVRPRQYFDREKMANAISTEEKVIFAGILYSGPVMRKDGVIVFQNNIKVQTDLMINLGNVIRSDCVLDFEKIILGDNLRPTPATQ